MNGISLNNENFTCKTHPESEITHICLFKNCFKFLCIKCIPIHLNYHATKKECAILEEFHLIKTKCSNSLQNLMNNFDKTMEKIEKFIEEFTNSDEETLKKDHLLLIDNLRTLIIKMIDSHFEKIKKDYEEIKKQRVFCIKEQKKEFQAVFSRIESLFKNFNEKTNISSNIQFFLSSNIEESFLKSSQKIEEYIEINKKKSSNIIKVDEFRIKELKESIKNCLFLQENRVEDEEILFKIYRNDYFERNSKRNYLHFFEENTKNLYLLNIEDYSNHIKTFSAIQMDIDFEIPDYHRSIALPNGEIYLIGGEMNLLEEKPTINSVFSYDFIKKTLISKSSMKFARNSFGIVFLCDFIYVFGGFDKSDNSSRKCERYSILLDEWFFISDIKEGLTDCCVAKFNHEFIYLFGGLKENNEINKEIAKYDPENDQWIQINFVFEDEIQQQMKISKKFLFPYMAACCQINEEEILIFGGKDYSLNFSSQILVLNIKETINVKIIEKMNLGVAGSFAGASIISGNQVLGLQNVYDGVNGEYVSGTKRIVRFGDNKCEFD